MALPLVVPVAEVREAMQLGPGKGLEATIEAEIRRAQQAVLDHVRTPIDRVTCVDDFIVSSSVCLGPATLPIWVTRLKLSRGIVDEEETISVWSATRRLDLGDADAREDLRDQADGDLVTVNAEKGLVTVTGMDLSSDMVRVSYTAGLTSDTGNDAKYQDVPVWLIDMVTLKAMINLWPILRSEKDQRGIDVKKMQLQYDEMKGAHVRYLPGCVHPFSVTATEA